MKKGNILEFENYGVDDIAFTVEFKNEHDNIENIIRVYFVTNEGISRHVNIENLNKCLDPNSNFKFDRDAFFFRNDDAVREAKVLLNCDNLQNNHSHNLKMRIKNWEKDSYVKNREQAHERTHEQVKEILKDIKVSDFLGGNCKPYIREEPKIGRNDSCPCGSGKKYKKCCMLT